MKKRQFRHRGCKGKAFVGPSVFDIMLPHVIEKMMKTVDDTVIKHITRDYEHEWMGEKK